jgi:hypothetical protein
MIITDHKHIPFGPYVAKMTLDPGFCKRLLATGKTLTKSHSEYLAGSIEHEYVFDLKKDAWIEEEFNVCIKAWLKGYQQFSGDRNFNPGFKLHPLWINFQKAKEYNPIHSHPGCNLSCVLYLEVPKEMLAEKRTTTGASPGHTGFMYGEDAYGFITHRIVRPSERTLLMFPSNLRHYVSHFDSPNVTRVSVSGNVTFKITGVYVN